MECVVRQKQHVCKVLRIFRGSLYAVCVYVCVCDWVSCIIFIIIINQSKRVWFFIVIQNKLTICSIYVVFHHVQYHHNDEFSLLQAKRRSDDDEPCRWKVWCGVGAKNHSHASSISRVWLNMCVSDLFNVARNVLFAHMFNIDWWMRWGLLLLLLVFLFFIIFVTFYNDISQWQTG